MEGTGTRAQQVLEPPVVWYWVRGGGGRQGDKAGQVSRGQIIQVSCDLCQIHLLEASWEHVLPMLRDIPCFTMTRVSLSHRVLRPYPTSPLDLAGRRGNWGHSQSIGELSALERVPLPARQETPFCSLPSS